MTPRLKTAALALAAAGVMLAGGAVGYSIRPPATADSSVPPALRVADPNSPYVSPLVACGDGEEKQVPEYKALNDRIEQSINGAKLLGKATDVSVYFRNLTDGSWVGVDQDQEYEPASLIKVPVMMAVLKRAEGDPNFLTQKVEIAAVQSAQEQQIVPAESAKVGEVHTVDELLTYMIVDSDNNATAALEKLIGTNALNDVLTDLGFDPVRDGKPYTFSPKKYSLFFRVLYNGTYLRRRMDEKALELLVKAEFKDGLRGGLPADVPLANKFGETFSTDVSGVVQQREIHDCGIAYVPGHPYFLCVMSKGKQLQDLEGVVQDVSKIVYQDATAKR